MARKPTLGPHRWQFELGRRDYSFKTGMQEFADITKEKMLNVVRESITKVIEDAEKPTAKGGKMRVDTGFLRNSGVATLNELPKGPSKGIKRPAGTEGLLYNSRVSGEEPNIVLAKMKIGDSFYYGWTASYAKYREAYDGFLISALQKWQAIVKKIAGRYK